MVLGLWPTFLAHPVCQLIFAAILWVKLREMFVTVLSLRYALLEVGDHYGHFLKTADSILFE